MGEATNGTDDQRAGVLADELPLFVKPRTTPSGILHAVAIALGVWAPAVGGALIGFGIGTVVDSSCWIISGAILLGIGAISSVLAIHFAQMDSNTRASQVHSILRSLDAKTSASTKANTLQTKELVRLQQSIDGLKSQILPKAPTAATPMVREESSSGLRGWTHLKEKIKDICARQSICNSSRQGLHGVEPGRAQNP